jgi:mRNA-degrading endonuclease HigB of HigAB toxin-antitoxin module
MIPHLLESLILSSLMDTRTYIASELKMRVVYEVDWSEKRILIHFIGSREETLALKPETLILWFS